MPHRGRTKGGKNIELSSEDHYVRKLANRIDGASQKVRKVILKALGFDDRDDPTREEVLSRIKKGVEDFDEIVRLAGGEKLPGCGAIVAVNVGYRPKRRIDDAALITEEQARRRLRLLNPLLYYIGERKGKTRHGKSRDGKPRKRWPGFVKEFFSVSPGDSQALINAVSVGLMTPTQLREFLRVLSLEVRDLVRKTTKLPGATAGLEAEMLVWHLEQGCLHCHIYARDIDITDPERSRLGLFGATTTATKGPKAERLTLNSLGISGVALRRHRAASHEAPATMFNRLVRDESGNVLKENGKAVSQPWLCTDWSVLETAEAKRAAKKLGSCWDVCVADYVDGFWKRVFSENRALKLCHDDGHRAWEESWANERAAKLKMIRIVAEAVLGPELAEDRGKIAELKQKNQCLTQEIEDIKPEWMYLPAEQLCEAVERIVRGDGRSEAVLLLDYFGRVSTAVRAHLRRLEKRGGTEGTYAREALAAIKAHDEILHGAPPIERARIKD